MKTPTIREAYNILSKDFELAGSDAPRVCAQALMLYCLEIDDIYFATNPHEHIKSEQWARICALKKRHEGGCPLAYIVGYKEFYGRKFLVDEHTLIPRPESEDVLEAAFAHMQCAAPNFVDIGTGSGCLGISFAMQFKQARGILLDIQIGALKMARTNAKNLGVLDRLMFVQGDLRNMPLRAESLDLILANPPYISEDEYAQLLPNVRNFEPKIALVPRLIQNEQDCLGLLYIEFIAKKAFNLLKKGGLCVLEHGYMQGESVRQIFKKYGDWSLVKTGQDLAKLDRFCFCKK